MAKPTNTMKNILFHLKLDLTQEVGGYVSRCPPPSGTGLLFLHFVQVRPFESCQFYIRLFFRLFKGFAREISARYNKDPYNMLQKMEMPGFWGVKNITDIEFGVPGQQ